MLSIRIDLLTDRYYATAFNDRNAGEWPPHPGRLYSALVATWAYEPEPDEAERDALLWLELQGAPELSCSGDESVDRRRVLTYFVPVNDTSIHPLLSRQYQDLVEARHAIDSAPTGAGDARKLQKRYDKALAGAVAATSREVVKEPTAASVAVTLLPESRPRQPRTFPAIRPDNPSIYFTWPDAQPDADRLEALDGILGRVGRLGHSSSLVAASVAGSSPTAVYVPAERGTMQLRVPTTGLLDALESAYAQHGGNQPRVLPNSIIGYGTAAGRLSAPHGAFSDRWILLVLNAENGSTEPDTDSMYRGVGGDAGSGVAAGSNSRPTIVRDLPLHVSLPWCRALRSAVQRHAPREFQGYIAGHESDGHPMERSHPAFVPLGFLGAARSDGRVRAFAVVPPEDVRDDEMAAIGNALRTWAQVDGGMRLYTSRRSEAQLDFASDEDLPPSIRSQSWCRESAAWSSATPIVLDRFPRGLNSTDPDVRNGALDHARQTVARAVTMQGLPQPIRVGVSFDALLRGTRPARQFLAYSHGPGSNRRPLSVHATIEFATPVRGPLIVGSGRHLGYGLMRPVTLERNSGVPT